MRKLVRSFSLTFAWLYQFVPWSVNQGLAHLFSFIWVDLLQIRKNVVYDNIDIAFPDTSNQTCHRWMKKSIYVLARNVFDLLKVPFLSESWIRNNVVFHGLENLQSTEGGVLFLTLHMASADLATAIISKKIVPLSLISKRFSNPIVDEFWFSLRKKSLTEFIDAHSRQNAFEILKALRRNRGVVFVLDQFMGKPYGVESQFFGKTTGTAYGLALFAQKTKRPVHPIYCYWDLKNRLHICIKPAVDISGYLTDDIEVNKQRLTNVFNRELEKIITEHPDQWMWVHRRWKVFE